MAHQSLYRAYRPQSFAEVAGQEQIVSALSEQLASGKVGHAYLFAGSRGLGKTSIARIFARDLQVSPKDIHEMDAASNNGVDEIRRLNENVYTLPFESPYKVYILDEAHMLSKGAWNAFLKTLEEPPAHAIFVLATTELEKVPETVRSRCQVFEFKKPTRPGLAALVMAVGKKEGYAVEPTAADLITLLADGSYRDALSILEKSLALAASTKLSREAVERASGAPKSALVLALVSALSAGDQSAALAAIRAVQGENLDMALFLALALEAMRTALLIRFAPDLKAELKREAGDEAFTELEALAGSGSKLSHRTLRAFLDASSRIRFAPIPALPLELAVLELFADEP